MIGFLNAFGGLWELFGDPGPSKMSVSRKRDAHFQKVRFFLLRLIFLGFSKFYGALGTHFGSPNVFKMGSKIKRKKCVFFGSPLERLGGANGALWEGVTLISPPARVQAGPVGRGNGRAY